MIAKILFIHIVTSTYKKYWSGPTACLSYMQAGHLGPVGKTSIQVRRGGKWGIHRSCEHPAQFVKPQHIGVFLIDILVNV